MRDMKHERRAAEDRRVDKGRRNPEILGERQARGAALRRRAEEAVDVAQAEPAIVERAGDALRHQVDDVHALGDLAEIGFGDADDRGRAALSPSISAAPAGMKTG